MSLTGGEMIDWEPKSPQQIYETELAHLKYQIGILSRAHKKIIDTRLNDITKDGSTAHTFAAGVSSQALIDLDVYQKANAK